MAWLRLLNPEVFQGNLQYRRYFEGWYLKHVSADQQQVLAFIPGISLTDKQAFIQVINGMTGQSWYMPFPLEEFRWNDQVFSVSIADNIFSASYSRLNLKNKDISLQGELHYTEMVRYPREVLIPGIMGPYSFLPFMECSHAVISATHSIQGSLKMGREKWDFSGGRGYIEKDWGRSFPRAWIWMQCNHFSDPATSLMVSIARIPYLGQTFNGLAAYLYLGGRFYVFTTWNQAQVATARMQKNTLHLELRRGSQVLTLEAVPARSGELKAPVDGEMSRVIKESVDARISFRFTDGAGITVEDKGSRAGLEIIEEMLSFLQNSAADSAPSAAIQEKQDAE